MSGFAGTITADLSAPHPLVFIRLVAVVATCLDARADAQLAAVQLWLIASAA